MSALKLFICGFPGSGKDTVAEILKAHDFVNLKFATGVYQVAHRFFDMDPLVKNRKLLQGIGQFARSIDPEYWMKQLIMKAAVCNEAGKNIIVTDCRFENEYKLLIDNGFTGLYVNSTYEDCISRMIIRDGSAQEDTLKSPSEIDYKKFCDNCIEINNSGTLEQLRNNVLDLYSRLKFIDDAKWNLCGEDVT